MLERLTKTNLLQFTTQLHFLPKSFVRNISMNVRLPKNFPNHNQNQQTRTMSSVEERLQPVFAKIDELKPSFISKLAEAIAIPAVSGDEELRPKVFEKMEWVAGQLEKLGCHDVKLRELGLQPPPVATPNLKLPPVVLARYGSDPAKKTVLVYAHADVQPASIEDGWNTEPFTLKVDEEKGLLIGRGSTDDTGPMLCWFNSLEAHQKAGVEIPVNLVFCIEGMEESGSLGLEQMIKEEASQYFKGVNYVSISDNYWLGTTTPALTYGLRGVNYYQIVVEGPKADLHSGVFGGCISEPMIDLVQVMSTLVNSRGEIQIEGIKEMVAPVTKEESAIYEKIHYSLEEFNESSNSETCLFDNKEDILMHRWRYPSLSLHGIEGAFSGSGAKTVIPAKVVGKFSIRTVPNIESKKLDEIVINHCNKEFAKLNSPNKFKTELFHDGNYWVSDPYNDNFTAAAKATKLVWGMEPDFTREGGSIPITLTFEEELKCSVVLIAAGRGNDGAHSINEKMDISNYMNGAKLLGSYLHYLAESE